jgi:hypothetical protein
MSGYGGKVGCFTGQPQMNHPTIFYKMSGEGKRAGISGHSQSLIRCFTGQLPMKHLAVLYKMSKVGSLGVLLVNSRRVR